MGEEREASITALMESAQRKIEAEAKEIRAQSWEDAQQLGREVIAEAEFESHRIRAESQEHADQLAAEAQETLSRARASAAAILHTARVDAEAEAEAILAEARAQIEQLKAEAAETVSRAELEAQSIRTEAEAEWRRIRDEAETAFLESALVLEQLKAEAAETVSRAEFEAQSIRAEAKVEGRRIRDEAEASATSFLESARVDAEELAAQTISRAQAAAESTEWKSDSHAKELVRLAKTEGTRLRAEAVVESKASQDESSQSAERPMSEGCSLCDAAAAASEAVGAAGLADPKDIVVTAQFEEPPVLQQTGSEAQPLLEDALPALQEASEFLRPSASRISGIQSGDDLRLPVRPPSGFHEPQLPRQGLWAPPQAEKSVVSASFPVREQLEIGKTKPVIGSRGQLASPPPNRDRSRDSVEVKRTAVGAHPPRAEANEDVP